MAILSLASRIALASCLVAGTACARMSEEPVAPVALPVMQWDHQPQSADWTEAALDALRSDGVALLSEVPNDISNWCPGYVDAPEEGRAAFWAGLLSALAQYESTWNEEAVGGGGRWIGLVQIAPATARAYGCEAGTTAELQDGAANLECAVLIASRTVTRDGVVAAGGGGFAADWGPFTSAGKRAAMAEWVREQDYCRA